MWFGISHLHFISGDFREAAIEMDKVLEPDNTHALRDKAAALTALGKFPEVADVLKKLTEADAVDTKSLLDLSGVLEQMQKYDEALEVYWKYLQSGASSSDVILKLSAIYLIKAKATMKMLLQDKT